MGEGHDGDDEKGTGEGRILIDSSQSELQEQMRIIFACTRALASNDQEGLKQRMSICHTRTCAWAYSATVAEA